MLSSNQKIISIRVAIHLIVLISFTIMLNEWALGLAISMFSRCYINKFSEKTYDFFHRLVSK